MMWQVRIHQFVFKEDFKAVPPADQTQILKTIQKKLTLDPQNYGKPLRAEFSGYWRLRVGDYRVVYRILESQIIVLVIKVGIRRDDQVYKELFLRIKKV